MPMTLRLPPFKETACRFLMTCGELLTEDRTLLEWLEDKEGVVRYRTHQGPGYLRVFFGGKSKRHCHIDIATREFFGDGKVPKITARMSDVQGILQRLIGQEIEADFDGLFWIPTANLPPIISSTLAESTQNNVVIKMVGGRLSVRGAPIHTIDWSIRERTEEARIGLEARKRTTITESYLEDAFSLLELAFRVFVLEKGPHASPAKGSRKESD
jgi:hypothetical protein